MSDAHAKGMPASHAPFPHGGAPKPPAMRIFHEVLDTAPLPEPTLGQYPKGLIPCLLPWLHCTARELLHVCSGALPPGQGIRVDLRQSQRPDLRADGRALPIRDGVVKAVLLDPPYTPDYAANLYGVEYPRPSHLLAEAARVVRPCGRIGFVHFTVPFTPPGCRLVKVLGLTTGMGYQMRAVTIFERAQDDLFAAPGDALGTEGT